MRAGIINKTPKEWLKDCGLSPNKIVEVLESYEKGATLRVCIYSAPHLFVRFHGASAKCPIHRPNYWADGTVVGSVFGRANQFAGMRGMTDLEIAKIAKSYYREITAICRNWNDLKDNELWKIELRGGEVVAGLEGPAGSQPTFAATTAEAASHTRLPGGATQVYLCPRTPFICTPVHWHAI
jgi:hypothetical protein